jgi:hypothetical protein
MERQAAAALDEARKLKHALKMADAAAGRTLRAQERRVLEDVVERMAARSAGALPVRGIVPIGGGGS